MSAIIGAGSAGIQGAAGTVRALGVATVALDKQRRQHIS